LFIGSGSRKGFPRCWYLALALSALLGHFPDALGQQYPLRHFSTENGLPKNMVAGIAQDEEGLLCVGTSGGVCRFDGLSFSLLPSDPAIDYFYAKSFLRDTEGCCWLGMSDNGLALIEHGRGRHFGGDSGLPDDTVWSLMEDGRGDVWIGTGKGLAVLRSEDRARNEFQFQEVFASELSGGPVYRTVEDADGRIWISAHGGLFHAEDGRLIPHLPRTTPGRCLARHPEGHVVVLLDGVPCRSKGESLQALETDRRLDGFQLNDVACSRKTVWIATYGQGLLKLEGGHLELISEKNGLITNYLYSLFIDSEDDLWIGSIHGLSQLYEQAVVGYTKDDGLITNSVHSLAEDAAGHVYLGSDDGLSVITPDGILTLDHSDEGFPVRRILLMKGGGRRDGVTALTEEGNTFRAAVHGRTVAARLVSRDGDRGIEDFHVELEDRDGNTWVGSQDSGIYRQAPDGSQEHWTTREGLPTDRIFEIGQDASGAIWFSTFGQGLLRYSGGRFDHYTTADGLPSNNVEVIYLHPATGELWFNTNNGPARWRGGRQRPFFDVFPEVDRLPTRSFFSSVADRNGDLWFATSSGVVRYDGQRFENFTSDHGLPGGSVNCIMLDRTGCVWVGGERGAAKIDPTGFTAAVAPPKIFITGIEARARPLPPGGAIELGYRDNDLRFVYRGLCMRYPRGLTYSFRLDGLDPEWSPFSLPNEVRFPALPAGRYVFSVRARNVRGVVSVAPARVQVVILPPLWLRWWFLLSSGGAVFLAGRAAYRWRVRQLLAVDRLRTRIAADLHDDIASSLASVSLYSEVIYRKMHGASADVLGLLDRIRDLSREAMSNIGLIVWTVDPRHDEFSDLLVYFRQSAAQLCAAAGISFRVRLPDEIRSSALLPAARRNIYLILKEGLSNSLRHAGCSEIEFACQMHGRALELTLRDDGLGFDAGEVRRGHGLANMRRRADAIGARMDIGPGPAGGTVLRLRLTMT
jgi:ligand-binding sensor domain-containing protein/signal transduction histidine kinase